MTPAPRMIPSALLVALLLFGVFGFRATFEPLEPSVRVTWRLIHGFLVVLALAGLVLVHRRHPRAD